MRLAHLLACVFLFLFNFYSYSQSKTSLGIRAVRVGDKMPDISLGKVSNNYTGKKRFSEFKGKLVILDFWNTTCVSCIEGFPKMEGLQKKFGDKVQVFLVNHKETQEQIDRKFKLAHLQDTKFPDLPSISDAKVLGRLFPTIWAGYTVLIDDKGIVRIINGSALNDYEEKIYDLIAGKNIDYITNGRKHYDENERPLGFGLESASKPTLQYSSIFTSFWDDYGTAGGSVEDLVDSVNSTVRNTCVNFDVLSLYNFTIGDSLKAKWKEKLLSFNPQHYLDYFLLFVEDTLQYTFEFLSANSEQRTDKNFLKSKFCYEQVVSTDVSRKNRRNLMLQDLNKYFGGLYGVEGRLEKRVMPCYILVRTSNNDKLGLDKAEVLELSDTTDVIFFKNISLSGAISSIIRKSPLWNNLVNNESGKFFFFDETGYKERVNMIFPNSSKINNIDALRSALKVYDLDIIQVARELEFMVVKENGHDNSIRY